MHKEWALNRTPIGWNFTDGEFFFCDSSEVQELFWEFSQFFRGIHPQYPPMYSHPGLPALERERLGLPPGPQHGLDPNEQMVSVC